MKNIENNKFTSDQMIQQFIDQHTEYNDGDFEDIKYLLSHRDEIEAIWRKQDKEESNEK